MSNFYQCLECGKIITEGVNIFSTKVHGFPLCLSHQCWIVESNASPEAKAVYFALKYNKIPVILEWEDKNHVADVAIPGKLLIEMTLKDDRRQEERLTELARDFYSWKEEVPTFQISRSTVNSPRQFKHTINRLVELCMEFKKTG
jgi:hypothetical protein